jgi:hypothetical protein
MPSTQTYWTVEYGGAERTFEGWRFSRGKLAFKSLAPDIFSVQQIRSVALGPEIPFEGKVIVRRGRTRDGNAFEGGRIVFVGYRTQASAIATAGMQGFAYAFEGPLYLLQDLMYRQQWYSGLTTHVLVGIDQEGEYVRTGAVIADVLTYAATQGVTIAQGSIEQGLYVPIDDKVDITCSEVMRQMARWSPDAVSWFDYSTEPNPTFHFRRRGDLEALTLDALFDDPEHRPINASPTPRYDLRKDYVLLLFESVGDVDGEPTFQITPQAAPEGHAGTGRRGLVSTINLRGPRFSSTEAEILSVDFTPGDLGPQGSPTEYWIERIPALQTGRYSNVTLTYLGAKDALGDDVDVSGFAYELADGQLSEDMELEDGDPVEWEKVRLWFEIEFEHADESGALVGRAKQRLFLDKTVTNAPSGMYTTVEQEDDGEPLAQFAGMAAYLLSATQELQFEGTHSLLDPYDLLSDLGLEGATWMGKVLNLSGGDAAWAGMNALITQVDHDIDGQGVTLKFGPAPHLELSDLLDLTRNNRNRRNNTSKRVRTEGAATSDAVRLGQSTPDTSANQQAPEYRELVIRDPSTGATCTINATSIVIRDADGNNQVQIGIGSENQKVMLLAGDLPANVTARFQDTDGCAGNAATTRSVLRQ